jgi:hypothetical protein
VSSAQAVIAHAVKVALLATLLAILVRRLWPRCWSFPAYLIAILVGNSLVSLWPGRFYTHEFWVLKQAAYDVLKLAVALELAWRTVRTFPGAAAATRASALVLLPLSLAVILSGEDRGSYRTLFLWQPQVVAATVWIFTFTALLVAWYRLPIGWWHRAILLGFTPYLFVFVTWMSILKKLEISNRFWAWAGMVDSVAYLALMCWWAIAAWRRHQVPEVTYEDLTQPVSEREPEAVPARVAG